MKQLRATQLDAIAREKAGMIKPGMLRRPPRARRRTAQQWIEEVAHRCGSTISQLGVDFDFAYRPPHQDGQCHRARPNLGCSSERGGTGCSVGFRPRDLGRPAWAEAHASEVHRNRSSTATISDSLCSIRIKQPTQRWPRSRRDRRTAAAGFDGARMSDSRMTGGDTLPSPDRGCSRWPTIVIDTAEQSGLDPLTH